LEEILKISFVQTGRTGGKSELQQQPKGKKPEKAKKFPLFASSLEEPMTWSDGEREKIKIE